MERLNNNVVPMSKVPRRGEIWWVKRNPIIPKDPHLPRPAVVVSTDPRNKTWDSVIVVPLSTSLQNPYLRFHKLIPKGEGGLDKESHARCDLVSNIEKSCLDPKGPIGPLVSPKLMYKIVQGIRAAVGDEIE